MKTGKTLTELAQELERIASTKRDLLVPSSKIAMNYEGQLAIEDNTFAVNRHTHAQLSKDLSIPKQYYDRLLLESPALLAENVNHGFATSERKRHLVRTLDGKARAILSDRYRIMDAHDLMNAILPPLLSQDLEIKSSEITETRMYLSVVFPKLEGEIGKGDPVQYGLVVSTSDVGSGSLRIEPLIYRLVCTNGLITSSAIRKYHIGRNSSEGADSVWDLLSDATRQKSDAALWAEVSDLLKHALQPKVFEQELLKLNSATASQITNFNLEQVVDLTAKAASVSLNSHARQSILQNLASGAHGAGLTKWGLANAFTFAANAQDDYDTSYDLMRSGGKIIDLNSTQWSKINEVA